MTRAQWLVGAIALASLVAVPRVGAAQTVVTVDCSAPDADLQGAINSFPNKLGANRLNITGTCSGTFNVVDFSNLTIAGVNGVATLAGPAGACGTGGPGTLFVRDSARVVLSNLTITGGGGLIVQDSTVLSGGNPTNVTVTGSHAAGVTINQFALARGASVSLTSSDAVYGNCGSGIAGFAAANVTTVAHLHDNGGFGLAMSSGTAWVQKGSEIDNNGAGGISLNGPGRIFLAGGHVHDNGGDPNANPAFRAGVSGAWGALVQIVGDTNTVIEHNVGPGVLLQLNSTGAFGPFISQSNSAGGVSLLYGSAAQFIDLPTPAVLTGNTGGDLVCDSASTVFGDISLVTDNRCQKPKK